MVVWWLFDGCLMVVWWLFDDWLIFDCLMIVWWLFDECLMMFTLIFLDDVYNVFNGWDLDGWPMFSWGLVAMLRWLWMNVWWFSIFWWLTFVGVRSCTSCCGSVQTKNNVWVRFHGCKYLPYRWVLEQESESQLRQQTLYTMTMDDWGIRMERMEASLPWKILDPPPPRCSWVLWWCHRARCGHQRGASGTVDDGAEHRT